MKRLLIIILVTAGFLAGYWCGRLPGSPDIFAWAKRTYPQVAEAGQKLIAELKRADGNAPGGPAAFDSLRGPESIGTAESYVRGQAPTRRGR